MTCSKATIVYGCFRCGVRLAIREKKQTVKSTLANIAGSKSCLSEAGLGMRHDMDLGLCMLGAVGKGIKNDSGSSNNINVYMSKDTQRMYFLDKAGKKGIDD